MEGLIHLDRPIYIDDAGSNIRLSQLGSLHKELHHTSLPNENYHYGENAVANLLTFAKLANDYYIICNTRINDSIYMQSKDDGKYFRFQRCKR